MKFSTVVKQGAAATVMLLMASGSALAWGGNGHAIVADIAQDRLTPTAAAQSRALLALEGHQTLDQVASWPDEIGNKPASEGGMPETLRWHYVNIDLDSPAYDAARDCATGNCVAVKLPEMIRTLADTSAPQAKRLIALKWVVHQVGDLHQPLHTTDRNHDKGGNEVKVSYFGETHKGHLNLHSVWDTLILEHETGLRTGPHYSIDLDKARAEAEKLNASITPAEVASWSASGLPADADQVVQGWVNESHGLAQKIVYGDLPTSGDNALGNAYEKDAWPVVRTRLEQAGVRLADVLNAALTAPSGSTGH